MLARLSSVWTTEQIALTVIILACAAVLATVRPRMARPAPGPTMLKSPDRKGRRKPGHLRRRKQTRSPKATDHSRWSGKRPPVVLAVVCVAVAAFIFHRGDDPTGIRPDSWSDANVIIAGQNYARYGLTSNWGASMHQVTTRTNPPDPFFIYCQYPVLATLINGLWQAAGVTSVRIFRLLPAICSLAAVAAWFGVYKRFAGQTIAVVAAITMATSYAFLGYADNLHFHAFALLSLVAAVRCYVRALAPSERRRRRWFFLTALFIFITALFTWEYHLWTVLFIAFYALLFECPVRRPYLALLALPLFAALTLQTAQRRLAFASVQTRTADEDHKGGFLDDAYRRSLGFEVAIDTPTGLTLSGHPAFLVLRFFKFYGVPLVAFLALLLVLLMGDRRPPWKVETWPPEARLVVVLLAAGSGWWLVMMQHTAAHPHVMRHALPAYSLLMALVWVRCWRTITSADFSPLARVAAAVLIPALLYPHLEGLVWDLRLHYTENPADNRDRTSSTLNEVRWFARLEKIIPPGAVILTNHARPPTMRLWSHRPVYFAIHYPIPRNDLKNARSMMELRFNHLRELYHDRLPSLYYVYRVRGRRVRRAFLDDPYLQLFLLGSVGQGEAAWQKAKPIVNQAWSQGHSQQSRCPIVAAFGDLICFHIDPAVPALRWQFGTLGFPTLRQFGPPR